VPVLWRPIHEMNDGWSWWGGRPGANGSRKLYQIEHDYLAGLGLTNLVWVWNVKDVSMGSIADYWPGASYVDVASLDVWAKYEPSTADYQALLSVAGGKPIALAEVGRTPSPALMNAQPRDRPVPRRGRRGHRRRHPVADLDLQRQGQPALDRTRLGVFGEEREEEAGELVWSFFADVVAAAVDHHGLHVGCRVPQVVADGCSEDVLGADGERRCRDRL
jgi:glycosyl hydrolase family 26